MERRKDGRKVGEGKGRGGEKREKKRRKKVNRSERKLASGSKCTVATEYQGLKGRVSKQAPGPLGGVECHAGKQNGTVRGGRE